MVASIQSLANMETQLYGGVGNFSAPSYVNGYNSNSGMNSYYNQNSVFNMPNMYGYNTNNALGTTNFGQTIPQGYVNQAQPQATTPFGSLSQAESKAMVDYYAKGLTPTQTIAAAGIGQAGFAIINHPRLIAHPKNSIKATKALKEVFKGVKDPNSALGKLWAAPETNELVRDAYFQMHKAEARLNKKLGLFRSSYSKNPENSKAIKGLMDEMKAALKTGNKDKIAEVTAKLESAYIGDGKIKQGWNWVKSKVTGKEHKVTTVSEALEKNAKKITERTAQLAKGNSTSFKSFINKGQGLKGSLFFAGLTLLLNVGKISTAFKKDKENAQQGIKTNNGKKQLGQSIFKSVGNAAGWALGEAAGLWAFTKWGAKIGTKFGPGIGTLLGGIVGLVGGGIGMCIADRASNAIVGRDVADKIEAENLSKTQEGQAQILQYTLQQAQSGKEVPYDVQQAATKVLNQFQYA